jgi:mono/diheme cytochrome c family protein
MKRLTLSLTLAALLVPLAATAADGKEIYTKRCAGCHGADGAGKTTMGEKMGVASLVGTKLSAAELQAVISDGRKKMPAYKEKMSADELKAVAEYVKALK